MEKLNMEAYGLSELSREEALDSDGGFIVLGYIAAYMTVAYYGGYAAHMAYDYITE